jgi:hypothetical protein
MTSITLLKLSTVATGPSAAELLSVMLRFDLRRRKSSQYCFFFSYKKILGISRLWISSAMKGKWQIEALVNLFRYSVVARMMSASLGQKLASDRKHAI